MTEAIKQTLKYRLTEYVERVTTKSKGGKYICPLCGSGTGANKSGAFSIGDNKTHWECFSCGKRGDLFDLIGAVEGLPTLPAQMKRAEVLFRKGLPDRSLSPARSPVEMLRNAETKTAIAPPPARSTAEDKAEQQRQAQERADLIERAKQDLQKTDYWKQRGFSEETVKQYGVGFVEQWSVNETAPCTPRLIIPTSNTSYLARDTREHIPETERAYSKIKQGKTHLFNAQALQTATEPIFVVEGELDALSILEVGGTAIGLGSINMIGKFGELVKQSPPVQPLILSLDTDQAGQQATDKLTAILQACRVNFLVQAITGGHKDPNEALIADRTAFKAEVERAVALGSDLRKLETQRYIDEHSVTSKMGAFLESIRQSVHNKAIPTTFLSLDTALDGGLYEGLYIVGAISSLGKTTLVTQIADQIARMGRDVMIFSLEMARTELMAKSISRHTAEIVTEKKQILKDHALTARGITDYSRYQHYTAERLALIEEATKAYQAYTNHLYIVESVGDTGCTEIREAVQNHKEKTGIFPVVVVDYLQILTPVDPRTTDKQNTDKAVLELKRMSRDFKIPVIGISSLNRASYQNKISMEAFKESGAIEYSSDVLIGLQLKGAGGDNFDPTEAKSKDPREVELVILKNRNGRVGETVDFAYYPMCNYFTEANTGELDFPDW